MIKLFKLYEMINAAKAAPHEKRAAKRAVTFSLKVRKQVYEGLQKGLIKADGPTLQKCKLTSSPAKPDNLKKIDWSNFDWQGAKEFWLPIIEAIFKGLKLFI